MSKEKHTDFESVLLDEIEALCPIFDNFTSKQLLSSCSMLFMDWVSNFKMFKEYLNLTVFQK